MDKYKQSNLLAPPEEWRGVEGFPGYQVSNLGRVKSLDRLIMREGRRTKKIQGRMLSPRRGLYGHATVSLCPATAGVPQVRQVPYLVLHAFVGAPQVGQICLHIDGDAANNKLVNLRWASRAEHATHLMARDAYARGNRGASKFTGSQIEEIRAKYKQPFVTQKQLAVEYGVGTSTINRIVHNVVWRRTDDQVKETRQAAPPVREHVKVEKLPGEKWRVVPSAPRQKVSDMGRVCSRGRTTVDRRGCRRHYPAVLLQPTADVTGHLLVHVSRADGKRHAALVHGLVLEAFVGPRPSGYDIRHLDGDPSNNRVENLAYGTRAENEADKVKHGTTNRGERNGMSKVTPDVVRKIRRVYAKGKYSQARIAKHFGLSREMVGRIVRRDSWAHLDAEEGPKRKLEKAPPCAIDFAPVWERWAYEPDRVEKWLDIPEYDGYYQASNAGRVKSVDRIAANRGKNSFRTQKGRMRAFGRTPGGSNITLTLPSHHPNGRSSHTYLVHRLVAQIFSDIPCPEGYIVRHLNGDQYDNRIENLCYGSQSENSLDRRKHGTDARGEKSANNKLSNENVRAIKRQYTEGLITQPELAKQYNVSKAYLNAILNGKARIK
jgi:DNA-binding transcriptional regulator YiaG